MEACFSGHFEIGHFFTKNKKKNKKAHKIREKTPIFSLF